MKIIETIPDIGKVGRGCVLTIGNFDGVHTGHRQILNTAKQTATQKKTELVAMTFEPHPVAILYPEKAPGILTPLELKIHLLEKLNVDNLIVLKNTAELLGLSPDDFVERFLVKNIQPYIVIEGENFNFGVGRAGNIKTLQKLGKYKGFEVSVVEAKAIKLSTGQTVRASSTMIRYMLESGHITDANTVLGRAYRLIGKIVPGRGRGKQLGFPTLNMQRPNQVILAEGVYAGFVQLAADFENACRDGDKIPAVFSIGQARTFGEEHPLLIEAHILKEDFSSSAEGWMAMDFIQHIRSQHKFKTADELAKQIANDCEKAKKILNR